MRICLVSHQYLPDHRAGAELQAHRLAKALLAEGHDVLVWTTRKDLALEDGSVVDEAFDGVPVLRRVQNLFHADFRATYVDEGSEEAFERHVLEAFRPELVHVQHLMHHGLGLPGRCHRRGVPVVMTLHDYWLECPRFGTLLGWDGAICATIDPARCGRCLQTFPWRNPPRLRRAAAWLRRIRRWTGLDLAPPLQRLWRRRTARGPGRDPAPSPELQAAVVERRSAVELLLVPTVDRFLCPSQFLLERAAAFGIPREKLWVQGYGVPGGSGGGGGGGTGTGAGTGAGAGAGVGVGVGTGTGTGDGTGTGTGAGAGAGTGAGAGAGAGDGTGTGARAGVGTGTGDGTGDGTGTGDGDGTGDGGGAGTGTGGGGGTGTGTGGVMRFAFLGSVLPHKGVHVLLEAAALLRGRGVPFELAVHGGSAADPGYGGCVARRGRELGVEVTGSYLPARIDELLAPVDVLVVPSLWYENSPVTIWDARVRGIPALVSDLGALPELVPEARLRFRHGDAEDLARAMAALVEGGRSGLAALEAGPMPPDPAEESRNTLKHYRALCR